MSKSVDVDFETERQSPTRGSRTGDSTGLVSSSSCRRQNHNHAKMFSKLQHNSHKMKFSRSGSAAIVATINSLAHHSSWIALPTVVAKSGIIFVHKRAAALFGNGIKTSDFFSPDGAPSRLAVEIHHIAKNHGLIAASAEMTACPIIIHAAEETMLYDEDQR